jgi:hypothetical protein
LPTLKSNLRNAIDLSSDGTLYTHCILLIYEILAADRLRGIMWEHHLSQLLHIAIIRIEMFGDEPLPFLVWNMAMLDTYASLSAGSNADLVLGLADNGKLPNPQRIIDIMRGHNESAPVFESDGSLSLFEHVLGLAQGVAILGGRLGRLSRQIRDKDDNSEFPTLHEIQSEQESYNLVSELKNMWKSYDTAVKNMSSTEMTTSSMFFPIVEEVYNQVS